MPLGVTATTLVTVDGMAIVVVDDRGPKLEAEVPLISPGERLAGADLARAAKVSIVRHWFAAGLWNETSALFKCLNNWRRSFPLFEGEAYALMTPTMPA